MAGGSLSGALSDTYGWSARQRLWWDLLRWPVCLVLTSATIAALLDHAPRRRQPALSWLALGSGLAVLITMASSGLLSVYIHYSSSFDSVYGPLAGVMGAAVVVLRVVDRVVLRYRDGRPARSAPCRGRAADSSRPWTDPRLGRETQHLSGLGD